MIVVGIVLCGLTVIGTGALLFFLRAMRLEWEDLLGED